VVGGSPQQSVIGGEVRPLGVSARTRRQRGRTQSPNERPAAWSATAPVLRSPEWGQAPARNGCASTRPRRYSLDHLRLRVTQVSR